MSSERASDGTTSRGNSSPSGRSPLSTGEHWLRDRAENQDIAPISINSQIASRNAIISIALIDRYSFTREAITRSLQNHCGTLKIQSFANCDECLTISASYDAVLYYVHQAVDSRNDAVTLSIKKLTSIAPLIILSDVDSSESIRSAFDVGVRGYIPTTSTNLELAIEIVFLIKVGGTFVPPSGLSSPAVKPLGTSDPVTTQFTARQVEVLDRLMLGKTNKLIAYELKMSESSVKTHIRNIMKKMKAANRTEVVCRARELEVTAAD